MTLSLSQRLHVLSLGLAGLAVVLAYYNDMRDAGAVSVIILSVNAIGAYIANPTAPPSSTP